MFATVCLALIIAACLIAKSLDVLLRALSIAPADALLYLGLAERVFEPGRGAEAQSPLSALEALARRPHSE